MVDKNIIWSEKQNRYYTIPVPKKGKDNKCWGGDNVSYHHKHEWVKNELGQPRKCEHCKSETKPKNHYQWANKSGKYLRDLSDWIRLCARCHWYYDKESRMKHIESRRILPKDFICLHCRILFTPKSTARGTTNRGVRKYCSQICANRRRVINKQIRGR